MTTAELFALIQSDPTALALAKAGNDEECAARLRTIAAPVYSEAMLTELSFYGLYADPADAETVLKTIETVAASNPFVARLIKWLQPGAPGVNFGDPRIKAALTAPVVSGGLGLSPDLAAPLLALGVLPPAITAADVDAVRAEHGGKI